MKIGDLVQDQRWYPKRKKWNDKRLGIVIGFHEGLLGVRVLWLDTGQEQRVNWDLTTSFEVISEAKETK